MYSVCHFPLYKLLQKSTSTFGGRCVSMRCGDRSAMQQPSPRLSYAAWPSAEHNSSPTSGQTLDALAFLLRMVSIHVANTPRTLGTWKWLWQCVSKQSKFGIFMRDEGALCILASASLDWVHPRISPPFALFCRNHATESCTRRAIKALEGKLIGHFWPLLIPCIFLFSLRHSVE